MFFFFTNLLIRGSVYDELVVCLENMMRVKLY